MGIGNLVRDWDSGRHDLPPVTRRLGALLGPPTSRQSAELSCAQPRPAAENDECKGGEGNVPCFLKATMKR